MSPDFNDDVLNNNYVNIPFVLPPNSFCEKGKFLKILICWGHSYSQQCNCVLSTIVSKLCFGRIFSGSCVVDCKYLGSESVSSKFSFSWEV